MMNTRKMLVVVLCLGAFGTACAKRPAQSAVANNRSSVVSAPAAPAARPAAAAEAVSPRALTEDEMFAGKSLADLNAERPMADVFFEYDSFELRPEAREALQRNAAWLNRWTSTRIVVEGHSDERGTAEYNIALGEQRAQQVRGYLTSLGVSNERMMAVGKGKEAPFCAISAESCWSQNRRGHFVLVAK
jgi:peptidoglycan-associated lipoprotein